MAVDAESVRSELSTRQLIWLETARRRVEAGTDPGRVGADLARTGARPRSVGLRWSDLERWQQDHPSGLLIEEAVHRAAELRPVVEGLVERWPSLAVEEGAERVEAIRSLDFAASRRAFIDIEEHEAALTDWVGITELFDELSRDPLYPRVRGLLLAYVDLHPGLQV
jgi:hypothetical protein